MQALLPVFLLRMLLEVVQSQRKDRTSSKLLLCEDMRPVKIALS
jgi:hypothetical protein